MTEPWRGLGQDGSTNPLFLDEVMRANLLACNNITELLGVLASLGMRVHQGDEFVEDLWYQIRNAKSDGKLKRAEGWYARGLRRLARAKAQRQRAAALEASLSRSEKTEGEHQLARLRIRHLLAKADLDEAEGRRDCIKAEDVFDAYPADDDNGIPLYRHLIRSNPRFPEIQDALRESRSEQEFDEAARDLILRAERRRSVWAEYQRTVARDKRRRERLVKRTEQLLADLHKAETDLSADLAKNPSRTGQALSRAERREQVTRARIALLRARIAQAQGELEHITDDLEGDQDDAVL